MEAKCPKEPLSTCVLVAGATTLLSKPLLGNQGAAGRSPPPNPHAVLRISGMSTWLSVPSVSGSKQPLGQSGVRWTRGPSPRKPTRTHPCSRRAPRLAPQTPPVPLTSADAAASTPEPGSTPGRCDSRPHPSRGQDVRPVSLGRGGRQGREVASARGSARARVRDSEHHWGRRPGPNSRLAEALASLPRTPGPPPPCPSPTARVHHPPQEDSELTPGTQHGPTCPNQTLSRPRPANLRRPCLDAWITGATVPRPPSSAQSPPPPGSLPCFSVRTALPQPPVTGSGGSTLATSGDTAPTHPTPAPFKPHRLQLPQLLSRRDGLRPQPGVPSPASARLPLQVSAQKTPRAPSRPSEPALPGHRRPPRPSADWGLGRQRLPREEAGGGPS